MDQTQELVHEVDHAGTLQLFHQPAGQQRDLLGDHQQPRGLVLSGAFQQLRQYLQRYRPVVYPGQQLSDPLRLLPLQRVHDAGELRLLQLQLERPGDAEPGPLQQRHPAGRDQGPDLRAEKIRRKAGQGPPLSGRALFRFVLNQY